MRVVEVTDVHDDPFGLLIEWEQDNNSAWMFADPGSYQDVPPF